MTYTGLFIMENSLVHDAPALGPGGGSGSPKRAAGDAFLALIPLSLPAAAARRRFRR